MTTVATLIEETFQHLYGGYRQTLNVLNGAVNASVTTWTFEDTPDAIAAGSFLACDDELVYVRTVDRTAKTALVFRGQRGSTPASHADDAVVDVNPRFPRFRVKEALRADIRSWPSNVFKVTGLNLDTSSGVAGYDLTGAPTLWYSVLEVQLGDWPTADTLRTARPFFRVNRNADTSIFASGTSIELDIAATTARDLRVLLSAPFTVTTWDDTTDLESDVGLPASMLDIPPLGAAWRLMTSRDIKRSFGEGQGEPRRAEEIPPGFAGSVATFLKRTRDARLSEEAARLQAAYPLRF